MQELRTSDDERPTFEETYPRYPFAPLVAMGLALGAWLHRQHRERIENAPPARVDDPRAPKPRAHAT